MEKSQYKATGKRDLEERTLKFASNVIEWIEILPKTTTNHELVKQLVRSAGSIGANYIEANEALGKKDFLLHLRICKKEAKETVYWLKLITTKRDIIGEKHDALLQEATELMKIFGAIVTKLQPPET
ncbi:MAG: four helix bundle protein [Dehalococcoidia bacterium]|nr:four helix bundle protein [Dehalococcoidia bacterium]